MKRIERLALWLLLTLGLCGCAAGKTAEKAAADVSGAGAAKVQTGSGAQAQTGAAVAVGRGHLVAGVRLPPGTILPMDGGWSSPSGSTPRRSPPAPRELRTRAPRGLRMPGWPEPPAGLGRALPPLPGYRCGRRCWPASAPFSSRPAARSSTSPASAQRPLRLRCSAVGSPASPHAAARVVGAVPAAHAYRRAAAQLSSGRPTRYARMRKEPVFPSGCARSGRGLKIPVSVVRFRPWAPFQRERRLTSLTGSSPCALVCPAGVQAHLGRQARCQQVRRQARVGALEHPGVGVAHRRGDVVQARAGRAQPGGVGPAQVVRRAVRRCPRAALRSGPPSGTRPGSSGRERLSSLPRASRRRREGTRCQSVTTGTSRSRLLRLVPRSHTSRSPTSARSALVVARSSAPVATQKAARAASSCSSSPSSLSSSAEDSQRWRHRFPGKLRDDRQVAVPLPVPLGELQRGAQDGQLLVDRLVAHISRRRVLTYSSSRALVSSRSKSPARGCD
jgi:hypothetical protein